MPKLMIVIAATREGRAGLPIGRWFASLAEQHGGFDVTTVDLAELDLPMFDEPEHPRFGRYAHEHTKRWSAQVAAADAFVFVTPEYNHGYPATLKNALDYLNQEWAHKPVGFVSYGGVAGGTRAVQQLKQVILALRMTPIVEAVNLPFHMAAIRDGAFEANDIAQSSATAMLDELARVTPTLAALRSAD